MKNLNKLRKELESMEKDGYAWKGNELVDVKVNPLVFQHVGEDTLHVSAEDGNNWADYYGEFRGGYPWIHPLLEAFAEKYGMYWEWDNPGSISLWD